MAENEWVSLGLFFNPINKVVGPYLELVGAHFVEKMSFRIDWHELKWWASARHVFCTKKKVKKNQKSIKLQTSHFLPKN